MWQLILLDWQKHHLNQSLRSFVICIIVIFSFSIFLGNGGHSFISADDFFTLLTILNNITFMIFSSTLLARIIIHEFHQKTIQVLFTYPIARKKLLLSKVVLVYVLTFAMLSISMLTMQLATWFVQGTMDLFPDYYALDDLLRDVPFTFTNACIMAGIALIPLLFGMRKKSTATTITSAVIISFLMNSTISNEHARWSLADTVIIPIMLAILGIGIAYLSFRKINKKDVV